MKKRRYWQASGATAVIPFLGAIIGTTIHFLIAAGLSTVPLVGIAAAITMTGVAIGALIGDFLYKKRLDQGLEKTTTKKLELSHFVTVGALSGVAAALIIAATSGLSVLPVMGLAFAVVAFGAAVGASTYAIANKEPWAHIGGYLGTALGIIAAALTAGLAISTLGATSIVILFPIIVAAAAVGSGLGALGDKFIPARSGAGAGAGEIDDPAAGVDAAAATLRRDPAGYMSLVDAASAGRTAAPAVPSRVGPSANARGYEFSTEPSSSSSLTAGRL